MPRRSHHHPWRTRRRRCNRSTRRVQWTLDSRIPSCLIAPRKQTEERRRKEEEILRNWTPASPSVREEMTGSFGGKPNGARYYEPHEQLKPTLVVNNIRDSATLLTGSYYLLIYLYLFIYLHCRSGFFLEFFLNEILNAYNSFHFGISSHQIKINGKNLSHPQIFIWKVCHSEPIIIRIIIY